MSLVQTAIDDHDSSATEPKLAAQVVFLTNFIPPYRLPLYMELANRVRKLTILLSTPMESNRTWPVDWGNLDVRLQRTVTVRRPWRHPAGFSDTLHVHVPADTLPQLASLRPDVIIAAELGFRSLFSAIYARHWRRTPLVLWLTLSDHTEQGRGRLRHALRRWLFRRADALIVNGAGGSRYVEQFGYDPRRVFPISQTVPSGLFERLPLERPAAAARRLLFVGRLVELKGLAPFIDALAAWAAAHPHETVEFDIAGSGPLGDQLKRLPTPPNLAIHFLGECDYSALAEVYAKCGILTLPTLSDEWGLVVNEAMSAGLPVLGSVYSQAVEELCREGENGWTFRPDSRAQTIEAIDRALTTPIDRLNAMRARARATVEHLTPARAVDKLLRVLEIVAANHRENTHDRY
ncbi:MAG TPA: glycosyltransferase family 4 protein [Pirellulales bacterium]